MHDTTPASVTLCEWSVRNASRIGLAQHGQTRGIQHAVLSHDYIRSSCSLICHNSQSADPRATSSPAKGHNLGMAATDHTPIVCDLAAQD